MTKPPSFPDYVDVSAIESLKDPVFPTMKLMDFLFFKNKTICSKCHNYKSFKLVKHSGKGDCFTIRCSCNCIIIYPKSDKRNNARLWVEIPVTNYNKEGKK